MTHGCISRASSAHLPCSFIELPLLSAHTRLELKPSPTCPNHHLAFHVHNASMPCMQDATIDPRSSPVHSFPASLSRIIPPRSSTRSSPPIHRPFRVHPRNFRTIRSRSPHSSPRSARSGPRGVYHQQAIAASARQAGVWQVHRPAGAPGVDDRHRVRCTERGSCLRRHHPGIWDLLQGVGRRSLPQGMQVRCRSAFITRLISRYSIPAFVA